MNDVEFVEGLKIAVLNAEDYISGIRKPAGRAPDKKLLELSVWYNELPHDDQRMVDSIIAESLEFGVWGFLCVLDGVRKFTNRNGRLKLIFEDLDLGESYEISNSDAFGHMHDLI